MERRKDKNNHVLKDGESYREKSIVICIGGLTATRSVIVPMHKRCVNCVRSEAEINRNKVTASAVPEAICA